MERWRCTVAEFENSRLLLSDGFVERFERIEADLGAVDQDDTPPDIYGQCETILREALPSLLAIAKAEIALTPAPVQAV